MSQTPDNPTTPPHDAPAHEPQSTDTPAITVAICTYKRISLFEQTLHSLTECDPVDQPWELIIIDNACEPAVETLVSRFTDRLPVRYFAEPSLGASHARNRAVREARAPIILFTDDDVTFDREWLAAMLQAIEAHPECAFWGGRVRPVWEQPRPMWFDELRCPMLGDTIVQYDRGDTPRPWDPERDPTFYTANLALRTQAIADAGYFDITVGHCGDRRMGMEDSLMVRAIDRQGGKGWYVADAVVNHPVPPNRLTRCYARQFAWRQGWLSAQITGAEHGRTPLWYYRLAAGRCLAGVRQWFLGLFTFKPGQRFAGAMELFFNASKIRHALTLRRSENPS